jgi:hypothetical protein
MTGFIEHALAAVHLLSAAGWFGALGYRLFFVDPKAMTFLDGGAEFERFALHLADGMRRVALAALLTCGLSGFALAGLRWNTADGWVALVASKTGLWLIAFAGFAYVSWVFWPRRVFATVDEWAGVRRQGVLISLAMVAIASLGIVLGQLCQAARTTGEWSILK